MGTHPPHPPEMRERARQLHESGLKPYAIADALGIGVNTAYRWLDPDAHRRSLESSRKVKERYRGKCRDCGGPTNGFGPGRAHTLCITCATEEWRTLTDGQIDYAVTRYVEDRVGVPTIAAELGSDHTTIRKHLLRRGVKTRPHRRGGWTRLPVDELAARYVAGESMYELARAYGMSYGAIRFQLVGAGVRIRGVAEATRMRMGKAAA